MLRSIVEYYMEMGGMKCGYCKQESHIFSIYVFFWGGGDILSPQNRFPTFMFEKAQFLIKKSIT